MNNSILILFLLLATGISIPVKSQTYTAEGGIAIAHKLREIKVLNEKGEQTLIERIRHTGEEYKPAPDNPTVLRHRGLSRYDLTDLKTGGFRKVQEISNATILTFLADCFAGEQRYRTGMAEMGEVIRDFNKKYRALPVTEESSARLQVVLDSIIGEAHPYFKGPKIEAAIPIEDSLPKAEGWTIYPALGMGDAGMSGLVDSSRSATGKMRSRILWDIAGMGLVESELVDTLLLAIKMSKLETEWSVLAEAARLTAFRVDYEKNKALELKFAKGLQKAGIMSQHGYERLAASYETYELKGKFGLIPFCERSIVLKVGDLPVAPQAFFDALYKIIQKRLLPDFNYSNLEATVYEDTSDPWRIAGDLIERKLNLRFTADGASFKHTMFYDFIGGRDMPGPKHPVNIEMTKPINKWMSAQSAPYRLYFASERDSNGIYGKVRFGLLLMTKGQYEAWGTTGSDYFIFEEIHDTTFTPRNIAKHLRLYDSLGLFSHLDKKEKEAGKMKAEISEVSGYTELLACYPKTVVVIDWETANLENPYEEILSKLSAASHGLFNPTNIKDNFAKSPEGRTTELSFDFGGKHYAATLKMEGDWLDADFLNLPEKALQEHAVDGKWYSCGLNGEYIFLNRKQLIILKKKQPSLLPDDEN